MSLWNISYRSPSSPGNAKIISCKTRNRTVERFGCYPIHWRSELKQKKHLSNMRCFSIPTAMKGAFKIKSASTWFAKFFIDQLHLALETFKKSCDIWPTKTTSLESLLYPSLPPTVHRWFWYRVGLITLDIPSVVHYILTCQDFLAVRDLCFKQMATSPKNQGDIDSTWVKIHGPTLILSYTPIAYSLYIYIDTSNTFPSPIPPFQETL